MKISEMTSDKAADVYLRIAPDIEELINDEELNAIMKSRKAPKNEKEAQKLGKTVMFKLIAHIFKARRQNAWNIVGALNDMTVEQVAKQTVVITLQQLVGVLSDKDLISFFTLVTQSVQAL